MRPLFKLKRHGHRLLGTTSLHQHLCKRLRLSDPTTELPLLHYTHPTNDSDHHCIIREPARTQGCSPKLLWEDTGSLTGRLGLRVGRAPRGSASCVTWPRLWVPPFRTSLFAVSTYLVLSYNYLAVRQFRRKRKK